MAEEELERAAVQRRERLRALRAAVDLSENQELEHGEGNGAERHGDDTEEEEEEEGGEGEGEGAAPPEADHPLEGVRFRNYIPRDKDLQPSKVIPPSIPKFDDPVAPAPTSNGTEDPFVSIAPKKANWDLRRDISKKLEKLERRTQRALIDLMQEEEKRRQELTEADGQSVEG